MVYKIFIVLVCFFLVGCAGVNSIKFGGGYGEYTGEVTIELDERESEREGEPVFRVSSPEKSEKVYVFSESDVEKIFEKISAVSDVVGVSSVAESKYFRLRKSLNGGN